MNLHHHHHVGPVARISLTLSLATFPYHSSPLAGLQGYIPYPHIAAECMFELVVLLLPGHKWGSIGVHPLWARLCFSSSVLRVWFRLSRIVFVMGGRWPYSWCFVGCYRLFIYIYVCVCVCVCVCFVFVFLFFYTTGPFYTKLRKIGFYSFLLAG